MKKGTNNKNRNKSSRYRGKLKATRNLLDLALFVGFFPQLVAVPIVRAKDFLPQLGASRSPPDPFA